MRKWGEPAQGSKHDNDEAVPQAERPAVGAIVNGSPTSGDPIREHPASQRRLPEASAYVR